MKMANKKDRIYLILDSLQGINSMDKDVSWEADDKVSLVIAFKYLSLHIFFKDMLGLVVVIEIVSFYLRVNMKDGSFFNSWEYILPLSTRDSKLPHSMNVLRSID